MNTIEIINEITIIDNNEYLLSKIKVDDITLVDFEYYALNFKELINSIQGSGKYLILTCHCGVAECAGIYKLVKVKHSKKEVKWYFIDPYPLNGMSYTFNKDLYIKAIKSGFINGKNLFDLTISKGKRHSIYPGYYEQSGEKYFYTVPMGDNYLKDKECLNNLNNLTQGILEN